VSALALSLGQLRVMHRQTVLPVVLDAFREARTQGWYTDRDWVLRNLAAEHGPDSGVSRLPEPARGRVRRVGFFFDNIGVFVAHRVVDQDLVIGFFGIGLVEVWDVLEPYIRREAELRGAGYMVYFENLVSLHRSRGPAEVYRRLGLRGAGPRPGAAA
jgi:hypothetical protein